MAKLYEYPNSQELFKRAAKVIPAGIYGHQGPGEGLWLPASSWPSFTDHAKGSYFWDVDGNRFIDYMCGYGPNILGYCDPDVDAAAMEQAKLENVVTTPSYKMVELAELMVDTVASADWAFFGKNGNDATQGAIMCARAYTHRKKIIFINGFYHGVSMWTQKKDYPGVLPEDVENNIYIPWNDLDTLKKVIEENKGEIAAFISTPYMHGVLQDNVLPAEGYWQEVRRLCTENGIILIVDDVRTGFRLDIAGSDHYYGFEADIICFCKAIANGWNISAICGKEFLKNTMGGMSYTGSYWMSAVPFAAGIACINKMKAIDVTSIVKKQGIKLTEGLKEVAADNGFDLRVSGEPSLFYLRIANDSTFYIHQDWIQEMVHRGIYMASHHNHFINASLSDEDITQTLEIADEAFKAVKERHPEME